MAYSGYKGWGRSSGESYRRIVEQWVNWNENGEGFDARSGNTAVSFVGPTLLSYKTPVAVYHKVGRRMFVLRSKETYTPTTSRHMNISCAYTNVPVFVTKYIGESGGRNFEGTRTLKELHLHNAQDMWEEILRVLDRVGRSYREEQYYNYLDYKKHVAKLYHELASYRDHTNQAGVPLTPLDDLLEEADRVNAENSHKWYHPNAVARRERAAARKIARVAFGLSNQSEKEKGA